MTRRKAGAGLLASAAVAAAPTMTIAEAIEPLAKAADLLTAHKASPFRIAAHRRAAASVEQLDRDVAELEQEGGRDALDAIPGVGRGIARAIAQILHTGR